MYPLPWWGCLCLALVAGLLIVRAYRRTEPQVATWVRRVLAGLRLAAAGVVFLMLSGAVLLVDRTVPSSIVLLVDDSASMAYPTPLAANEKQQGATRFGAVIAELRNLNAEGPIRVVLPSNGIDFTVDSPKEAAARLEKVVPSGPETRLGDWVLRLLRESNAAPRAILVFSDGVNTAGPGLEKGADAARKRGVPLFCVAPDGLKVSPKLTLSNLLAERTVFPGDPVVFRFSLGTVGLRGKNVRIRLQKKGASRPLDEKSVTIERDGTQNVQLTARPPDEGETEYEIIATVPQDKQDRAEDRLRHVVNVRTEPIRVLLAAGCANFEYRFLRSLLVREDSVAARIWLASADPLWIRQNTDALDQFPADRESLLEYDVVVLNDVSAESLGPKGVSGLVQAVRSPQKGPSLVFITGSKTLLESFRGTMLEELLPIRLNSLLNAPEGLATDGTTVDVTSLGLAFAPMQLARTSAESRRIWESFPPIYGFVAAESLRPGAAVLLQTSTALGETNRQTPLIVTRMIGSGRVWFQGTDESWRWRDRSHATLDEPFYARYWLQTLRYLALSRVDSVDFSRVLEERAEEASPEQMITAQDTAALMEAAKRGGGSFVPLDRLAVLSKWLPRPRPTVTATSAPVPLWNAWYTLLALFLLLGIEWGVRRANRLI